MHTCKAIICFKNKYTWIKIFSIQMRILNSKNFFLDLIGFNWIQLDSTGCKLDWIEKLHFLFKILN